MSGPIVFVAVGVALGPLGFEWFNPSVNFGNGKLLIDLTLALFLFVDAASANLTVLKKNWRNKKNRRRNYRRVFEFSTIL